MNQVTQQAHNLVTTVGQIHDFSVLHCGSIVPFLLRGAKVGVLVLAQLLVHRIVAGVGRIMQALKDAGVEEDMYRQSFRVFSKNDEGFIPMEEIKFVLSHVCPEKVLARF